MDYDTHYSYKDDDYRTPEEISEHDKAMDKLVAEIQRENKQ